MRKWQAAAQCGKAARQEGVIADVGEEAALEEGVGLDGCGGRLLASLPRGAGAAACGG